MECMCPILGRTSMVRPTRFSRDAWTIVQCLETGFVFLANPPSYARLEEEFAWQDTYQAEKRRRATEEPWVAGMSALATAAKRRFFRGRNKFFELARAVLPAHDRARPLRFLDIGCGWGHLLENLHERFAQSGRRIIPCGIEVSRVLAARSGERLERLGGTVLAASAMAGIQDFAAGSVDVVIMSSFLEHECQPLPLLQGLYPVLRDDGVILLKVPNFACWNRYLRGRKWCGFRFPDHVNYFTPRTLRRLAETAHFTVFRQGVFERFPLSDNMYAILKKQPAARRAA